MATIFYPSRDDAEVIGAETNADRNRYKHLLAQAVKNTGQVPLLGGLEHAEEIVNAMNLPDRKPKTELDEFVSALRSSFRRWGQLG